MQSFWQKLSQPIIGLAPMDGVTDIIYRLIQDYYGKPSVTFTEFVPVEGLTHGATKLLDAFLRYPSPTPQIAQIYGNTSGDFYLCALLVCELGFDGIDINMGCPAQSVISRGAGAGLIRTPDLALEIIKKTQQASLDFANGMRIEKTNLSNKIKRAVVEQLENQKNINENILSVFPNTILSRNEIDSSVVRPVSVKTRTGYETPITREWISILLSANLDNITLHGRTLKQGYRGESSLEEIKIAADLIGKFNETSAKKVTFLASGDALNKSDAISKSLKLNTNGMLIGRASNGNPWVFTSKTPTQKERLKVALDHATLFSKIFPDNDFRAMRKHLAWYTKGFDGASALRVKLCQVRSILDVKEVLKSHLD